MTLVLACVNSDAAVVVADCLISTGGRPFDDEVTKIALVTFDDARLAMSYTGLASVGLPPGHRGPAPAGAFRTIEWLGNSLIDLGAATGMMIPTLGALKDRLDAGFPPIPLNAVDRLLIVGFVGYRYEGGRIIKTAGTIGNAVVEGDRWVGGSTFEMWTEEVSAASMLALGRRRAIVEDTRLRLADLVSARRPALAVAEKATGLIREAARHPAASGSIGDLCMSLVVPADASIPAVSRHHADKVGGVIFQAHSVRVAAGGGLFVLDPSVRGGLPGQPASPIAIPKVSKYAPCPCGSGKKYKWCHGRPSER